MRLRFSDEIKIQLDIPKSIPEIAVPPLLTISFIENAFKHGISYEKPSFIHIRYTFPKNEMYFEIKNTAHANAQKVTNSGIGIQNTQKRLSLIYKDNYKLDIQQDINNIFIVKLNIPV